MKKDNLPTDDLKEFGIINSDNTFSKKLSEKDIENFLNGHAIVADNGKNRLIFLLTENNTRLNVNVFERDKSISDIVAQSQKEIVYSDIKELTAEKQDQLNIEKKVFILDEKSLLIQEYDLLRDTEKIASIIAEKENPEENKRFKANLLKLKEFLQDKIDKFPEIAKEITNNLNIVSKTINTIDDATPNEEQSQQQKQTKLRLDVNDDDLYQEANEMREENQRRKGFRR